MAKKEKSKIIKENFVYLPFNVNKIIFKADGEMETDTEEYGELEGVVYYNEDNRTTVVILDEEFKGIATCSEHDSFNKSVGFEVAFCRAYIELLKDRAKHAGDSEYLADPMFGFRFVTGGF